MDNKTNNDEPRWHGDEVEDAPSDEAEQAASRAEGNAPVGAEARVARSQTPGDDADRERRQAPTSGDPEGDIADAAEEHRARQDAGERPPRGKI